jgi:hypothetical protein
MHDMHDMHDMNTDHRARRRLAAAIGVAIAVIATLAPAQRASAQAGTTAGSFVGSVARDSAGHGIPQAEVRLPDLRRLTTTNYLGEFRFAGLAAGTHAVLVRSIGFAPYEDSIVVKAGSMVERDYVMSVALRTLDTVRTTTAAMRFLSPALNAVEARRTTHAGGSFIMDSVLRASENEKLPDLLGRMPGIVKVPVGANTYLASGRATGDGGPVFLSRSGANAWCFVTVYENGIKTFQGPSGSGNAPPDFNRMNVSDYSAVEYYPGGASLPPQFNATGSSCGTLLLWTRER